MELKQQAVEEPKVIKDSTDVCEDSGVYIKPWKDIASNRGQIFNIADLGEPSV